MKSYIKQGDCLELMKEIPDKSIDMILCDLPYGTTACKWDVLIPFKSMWTQYNRIIKDNGAIILFASQPFTTKLVFSNFHNFRYCWYWKKNNVTGALFAKVQPMRCVEEICVFYRQKPTYNPQGLIKLDECVRKIPDDGEVYGRKKNASIQTHKGYPKNLLKFKNIPSTARLHPTQKPVELLEYLIKTYTNEGETVLDNCMGSGSTGVAALNNDRNFIGFELDGKYFDVAKGRLNM